MLIGSRLRAFRELKKLTQGYIEKRTGFLRSYISRTENNHTTPHVETLEKWARALEVPLYQLFYEEKKPAKLTKRIVADEVARGAAGKEVRLLEKFRGLLARITEPDRKLLLYMARKMVRR